MNEGIADSLISVLLAELPVETIASVGAGLRIGGDPGEPLPLIGGALESLAASPNDPWLAKLQFRVALYACACDPVVVRRLASADDPPWPAVHAAVSAVDA